MDIVAKKVGAAIRLLREQQGYSQESFAQWAQIERARYGKIERGQLNISLRVLKELGAYLNVNPGVFFTDVTVDDCMGVISDD